MYSDVAENSFSAGDRIVSTKERCSGDCARVHILKHSGTDEVRLHTRGKQPDLVCSVILQCMHAGLKVAR